MRPGFARLAVAPLVLAVALSGCAGSEPAIEAGERTTTEAPDATTGATTVATEERPTVDLRVVSGTGGVFAFAEVFINGEGPFAFTVDTGASRSVLDSDLVERVGVRTIGEPVEITGITCRGEAGRARVRGWRVGGVRLPQAVIQTVDMPEPPDGTEIDGLLGSDILSRFGTITVDYDAELLVLEHAAS
jgi:predicted aspartyl protease